MATVPAHVVAAVDQHRAALGDLVRLTRDHCRRGCDLPGACAGPDLMNVLYDLDCNQVAALAFTAIVELAALGYGEHQGDLL